MKSLGIFFGRQYWNLRAALLLFLAGCATPLAVLENEPYQEMAQIVSAVKSDSSPPNDATGLLPATVRHLDRPIRYMTLSEAIALALEQGTTGIASARNPGNANDDLVSFTGSEATGTDSIRVFALQPAIASANIDLALSRFDPQAFTNFNLRNYDEPLQGLNAFQNGQNSTLSFGLAKPLATGGVAGLSWTTDYSFLSQPPSSVINPSYFTRIQFGFEQPLLQGNGVFINQLLSSFPSSSLFPALDGRFGAGQGILIARIRNEQQRAEFERRVNHLLLNVEAAYWNLYAAYIDLYSTDQALRMATEVWRVAKELFPEKIDEGDFAGTRAQLQFFRGNRLQNIGRILDAERNLRLLLGLAVEDGQRLVPIDTPSSLPQIPDWHHSKQVALNHRPELVLAREEIKRAQYQVDRELNRLQPDLRFVATYDMVGLGSRLDGNGQSIDANGIAQTNNALRSLTSLQFNDYTLGLRLTMPLGYRAELAAVRQAKLALAQAHLIVKEQEVKTESFLAKQYSKLIELIDVIETRRQQRIALAEQLDVRFRKFSAGKIPVDFLQDSVRQWTTALSAEYRALTDYNTTLATFHFAKGTLMEFDSVHILEGKPGFFNQIGAVVHEKSRTDQVLEMSRNRVDLQPMDAKEKLLPPIPPAGAVELSRLFEPEKKLVPPPPPETGTPSVRPLRVNLSKNDP